MIFKCKNCSGNTIYSPELHAMYCPYCSSENTDERKNDAYNIEVCPDCGGELAIEQYTSALQCKYCNNYIILNERVEGDYQPHKMIPFKLSKEMVKKSLKDKFKKCVFAPSDFLAEARLDSMCGEYVPFWVYDYKANCTFNGEGTKVRTWRSGNTEYTETSYYSLVRNLDITYNDIPADASIKMNDGIMDLLEPYNYNELIEFSPNYMSGFMGEKYNLQAETLEPRAKEKMTKSAEALLSQSISGYSKVTTNSRNINATNTKTEYCLLPVWKYDYSYKEEKYPFYVNGQTGKIIGKVPVCKKKVFSYGATLWAVLTALMFLLGYIAERLL